MSKFEEKVSITNFNISSIDTSEVDKVEKWLPIHRAIDLNVAEQGLVLTLHAQNICQEQIAKIDRYLGLLESKRAKAWSVAALVKSELPENKANCKTAKAKEWFAQQDDDYIDISNEIALIKAGKKWFENKAGYFSSWHYAFKTFLKRDYSLESIANLKETGYNTPRVSAYDQDESEDIAGEVEWDQ